MKQPTDFKWQLPPINPHTIFVTSKNEVEVNNIINNMKIKISGADNSNS